MRDKVLKLLVIFVCLALLPALGACGGESGTSWPSPEDGDAIQTDGDTNDQTDFELEP